MELLTRASFGWRQRLAAITFCRTQQTTQMVVSELEARFICLIFHGASGAVHSLLSALLRERYKLSLDSTATECLRLVFASLALEITGLTLRSGWQVAVTRTSAPFVHRQLLGRSRFYQLDFLVFS